MISFNNIKLPATYTPLSIQIYPDQGEISLDYQHLLSKLDRLATKIPKRLG